jgi:T1SS-143 domain-containing protein
MANENTQNTSTSNQPVGSAIIVYGSVQAHSSNGATRAIQPNSPIFANDRVVTGNNGMVSIVFQDAANTQLDLGRMSDVTIDEEIYQGYTPEDLSEAAAEVEDIQEALIAGEFDPTTELEAPAAGPGAGVADAGGGSSFVKFDLTAEEVTPESGAETTGISIDFLDPDPDVLEPVPVTPVIPPTPVTAATTTVAPADTPIIPPPPPPPPFTPTPITRVVEEEGMGNNLIYGNADFWPLGANGYAGGPGLFIDPPYPPTFYSDGNPDDIKAPDTTTPEDIPQDDFQPDSAILTGSLVGSLTSGPATFSFITTSNLPQLWSQGQEVNYFLDPAGQFILAYVGEDFGEGIEVDRPVFSLELTPDGQYRYIEYDQLDHTPFVDRDGTQIDSQLPPPDENIELQSGADHGTPISSIDFSGSIQAIQSGTTITFADGLFSFIVVDDIPIALEGIEEAIGGTVLEDGLVLPSDTSEGDFVAGNPDLSDGNKEPGETQYSDEASAPVWDSNSISNLFKVGADEFPSYAEESPNFISSDAIYGVTQDIDLLNALPTLYSNGTKLEYESDGQTLTASAGANVVFTFRIDPNTGTWIFDLEDQLDHVAGNGENFELITSLDNSTPPISGIDLSSILTATDFDNDMVTGAADGSFILRVGDDIPDPTLSGLTATGIVHEDVLDSTGDDWSDGIGSGVETLNIDLSSLVNANVGADENGSLTFSFTGLTSGVASPTLTSGGSTVYYHQVGNTLVATTSATPPATVNDPNVFTFTINDPNTGSATFELNDQLDHSLGTPGTDSETLNIGDIGNYVQATVTDADDDFQNITLDGAIQVTVENDVPQAVEQPAAIVGEVLEDGLSLSTGDFSEGIRESGETTGDDEDSGSTDSTAPSNLANLFDSGADEDLSFGISTDSAVLNSMDTLYSNGQELHYLSDGTTLQANTAADGSGTTAFTLQVNPDGSWIFDLKDQLDHVDDGTNTENWELVGSSETDGSIDFSSVITATDADGDTATGVADNSFRVKVQDDIPAAEQVEQEGANMNLVLILDNSGSMYLQNIQWQGGSVPRIEALQASVVALLTGIATNSDAGATIKVHLIEYNTDSTALGTFTITGGDTSSADSAIAAVNSITIPDYNDSFTNYEAGYQQALQWINSGDPLTQADVTGTLTNEVMFISDGSPNRWNDPDYDEPGGPSAQGSDTTTALQQVTGSDGSNEANAIDQWADHVNVIGINVTDSQDDNLDTLDPSGNALNITTGDELLTILPELLQVSVPIISSTVEEDDLSVDGDNLSDPDSSTGINEDGSSNADEAFGSSVSTDATNLANLFTSGADEELTYSLSSSLGGLPTLYSDGTPITYQVQGNILTGSAGGETVFTFTVNTDGSWVFDLDNQLDHAAGGGENFELLTGDGTDEVDGIDLSSVIVATDADGDEVTADAGAFIVRVQDDVPEVGTPQDSMLGLEEGNSLTASLDIQGSGADDPASITLMFVEGQEVQSVSGSTMTNNGDPLFWHDNGDGSWSAVTKDGSGDLDPVAKSFTISVDETAGTYTVTQDDGLDGANSVKTIDFSDALNGGHTYEAVFGSGGTSSTVNDVTTYTNGVFVWARASTDLSDPFGWNGSSDTWTNDTETVNYANQGVGAGGGNMVTGKETTTGRDSEILSFKFFSQIEVDESGNNQEAVRLNQNNSSVLDLTAVTLVLDHLGTQEEAVYTIWNDGQQVSGEFVVTNTNTGVPKGGNSDDDFTIVIDSSQLSTGTVFDEIRLEASTVDANGAPKTTDFRIQSAEVEIFQEGVDETILVPVEIADADGDVIETDFSVTFDGKGDLNAATADAADGDISSSGMVISGTSGSDTIIGTDYNDTIDGRGGDDNIDAGDGNDYAIGGTGLDTIDGGGGNDILIGGEGNDFLVGDIGDDLLFGGAGDDTLQGDAGNDQLVGGDGVDIIDGGADDDIVIGDNVDFGTPGDSDIADDGGAVDIVTGGDDTGTGGADNDVGGDANTPADDTITDVGSVEDDIDTLIPPPDPGVV